MVWLGKQVIFFSVFSPKKIKHKRKKTKMAVLKVCYRTYTSAYNLLT